MSDVLDIEGLGGAKAEKERARIVEALRALASRFETVPDAKLLHTVPIAAAGLEELERRLAPWLR